MKYGFGARLTLMLACILGMGTVAAARISYLNITDRDYSVGCSMRYGRGEWFPGCYKERQVLEAVPTQLPTRPRFPSNKRNTTSLNLCSMAFTLEVVGAGRDPPR